MDYEEFRELWSQGWSKAALIKRFGFSESTYNRYRKRCQRAGVEHGNRRFHREPPPLQPGNWGVGFRA